MDINYVYNEFSTVYGTETSLTHMIRFGNYIKNIVIRNPILYDENQDEGISEMEVYFLVVIATRPIIFNCKELETHHPDVHCNCIRNYTCAYINGYQVLTTNQLDWDNSVHFQETLQYYEDNYECIPFCRIVQLA